MLKILAATAVATLIAAGGASAATLSFSAATPTGALNPVATAISGDVQQNATGSIKGGRRSPFEGGAAFDDAFAYTSIGGGGRASYSFGHDSNELSFIWGSPDDFNHFTFYNDGEAFVAIAISDFSGANLEEALATITTYSPFDQVVLSSGANTFEFAQLSAALPAVPLPAAGLLLLSAIGGIALARRRTAR